MRRSLRLIGLAGWLSATWLVGACEQRAPGTTSRDHPSSVPPAASGGSGTTAQADADATITTSVRARYFTEPALKDQDVDVATESGIVTLTGRVESSTQRDEAERLASAVAGVARVDNRLVVGQAGTVEQSGMPAALGSAWLTTKITSQFFADNQVRGSTIDVTSNGGVVTLEGTVSTDAARGRAVQIARATDGVRDVVDRLRVVPADAADGGASRSPVLETIDDARVTAQVQAKYFLSEDVKGRSIDVDTDRGVVTLSGDVASQQERNRAVALAASTRGVTRVIDALRVRGDQAEARTAAERAATEARRLGQTMAQAVGDGWLTSKVQAQFYMDDLVKGQHLTVSSNQGVVTLEGTVGSDAVRRRAVELTRDTAGVTQVVDNLAVGSPVPGTMDP